MIKKTIAFAVSLMLLFSASAAYAANAIDGAKEELKETQQEIKAINAKKKEAKKTLLNDKKVRDNIIADLEQKGHERTAIEEKIKEIEAAIQTLNDAIAQAQREYDDQLKLFQERLVVLYVHSRTNANVNEILKSTSYEDMFKSVHMLQLISKFDQDLMTSLENKEAEIQELKGLKEDEENNAEDQLESSLDEIAKLEVSRSTAEERVSNSQKSLAKLEKAEDELEKDSKELEKLIKKLSSTGTYSGIMQWPLPGYYKISSYFGMRMHPILKYKKMHGGIDIGAPSGTYIHAAAYGTVIWSGWRSGGSGNTIIIDHGSGISTLYFHIKSGGLMVKAGQKVKAGAPIAKVGSTGLSTGPHLHFEVRKNGERQNPLNYVSNKK